MPSSTTGLLLAGDIGATKTTLALYDPTEWPSPSLRQQTYRNADVAGFPALLHDFLEKETTPPACACFGVAGPVMANAVHMTNLDWSLDGPALQADLGCHGVFLINDLVATAMGVPLLLPQDLRTINQGSRQQGAAIAVLAPGSGLGEAFLIDRDGRLQPCPSEGGHASFAPRTEEQIDLLAFMRRRYDHISVEMVCSGLAVPELFAFLAERMPVPSWLQEALQGTDRTPIIVQAAIQAVQGGRPCQIAVQTLRLLTDILADEAANLALKTLALDGLYIGGGFAARIEPFIEPARFMKIFCRGTYRQMLARIPVHVIANPHTALQGAAAFAIQAMERKPEPIAPGQH
jgi:glucokinase